MSRRQHHHKGMTPFYIQPNNGRVEMATMTLLNDFQFDELCVYLHVRVQNATGVPYSALSASGNSKGQLMNRPSAGTPTENIPVISSRHHFPPALSLWALIGRGLSPFPI